MTDPKPPRSRPAPQLLSLNLVAARLALSVRSVRRLIDRGELPAHKIGGQIRVAEDDLRAFVHQARL